MATQNNNVELLPQDSEGIVPEKAEGTTVVANPELEGGEDALLALQVGDEKYKINQPTTVVANPEQVLDEPTLTDLQVGNDVYKIPQPTAVEANPELSGSEAQLKGLKVGNTSFKTTSTYRYPTFIIQNSNNEQVEVHAWQVDGDEEGFYSDFNTGIQNLATALGITVDPITDRASANAVLAQLVAPLNLAGAQAIAGALLGLFFGYATAHYVKRFGSVLDKRQYFEAPLYVVGDEKIFYLDDSGTFKSFTAIAGIDDILDGTYTLDGLTLVG